MLVLVALVGVGTAPAVSHPAPAAAAAAVPRLESRIVVENPADGTAVARGVKVPVQGRLELRRPDGSWAPAENKQVTLHENVSDSSYMSGETLPVTGGRFSGHLVAVTPGRSERFEAVFAGDSEYAPGLHEFQLKVSDTTRFFSYNVDIPSDPGSDLATVRINGSLVSSSDPAQSWSDALTGRTVAIDFKPIGAKSWKQHGTVRSATDEDRLGEFYYPAKARTPGHWRARFAGEPGYLPSASPTVFADNGYDTKIVKFDAGPEPVHRNGTLTVTGRLLRWTGSKWVGGGTAPIRLEFKARGSKSWQYVDTVGTDRTGRFRIRRVARRDGTWRVDFQGSMDRPRRQTTHTVGDYVDVR